ncbi:MAG: glycoside hydrolase family 3 C-terminal domain-containing protein [Bacteroidales bacterium]|nr:glycoside hydrolase family 3 C-terminal domain-containing protein [Bacteroidales bacterium]
MKKFILLLAIIIYGGIGTVCAQNVDTLPIPERVEYIISQLTLDEKLSLMEHHNPAIERLGLQEYSWWNEALHGVGRNGLATVWPMPIALAATFYPELVQQVFAHTADEARTKYLEAQAAGNYGDYAGLTFFTPNINILRDPRWGRGMETYGEDPFLTAQMGLACVNGLQHAAYPHVTERFDSLPLYTAACLKHLAVHSGPEGTRHQFDATVSPRDLWTTYLPAFEYIIKNSDVQQVMCAYNRLNGEPCCTNKELLVNILRNKWNYNGLLVTDCWALNDCWERDPKTPRHETHATAAHAAADAFGSEVDLECGSGLPALRAAVDSGWISESQIDEHVRRILTCRLRISEEHPQYIIRTLHKGMDVIIALQSLVLLKNDGVLPLKNKSTHIFLAGPNATDSLMPLGNYNGIPEHTVTIEEGLRKDNRLTKLRSADVIVYAGGLNPQLEGEELPIDTPGFYKGDRTWIELPENQIQELKKLKATGKPIVLLLCTGSAIALEEVEPLVDAIMVCWYGGQEMGSAISSALNGHDDDFGRLPVTFYRSSQQLPDFESYDMQGRTYRYMEEEPLYPFGYGLSYAVFSLTDVSFNRNTLTVTAKVKDEKSLLDNLKMGDVGIQNTTVVQVYLSTPDRAGSPKKSLVAFQKIGLFEGRTGEFQIPIDPFWLRVYDEERQEMVEPPAGTRFVLEVGFSSADPEAKKIEWRW